MDDMSFSVQAYDGERWISEGSYPEEVAREIYTLLVTNDLGTPSAGKIRITLFGPARRGTVRRTLSEYQRGMEER